MKKKGTRIRRVRTPAGARKYGQPIGTVIVPDSPIQEFVGALGGVMNALDSEHVRSITDEATNRQKPTGVLKKGAIEGGWQPFTDADTTLWVGKYEGLWYVTDDDDTIISDGFGTKGEAVTNMHAFYREMVPDSELQQFPRRSRGKYSSKITDVSRKRDKMREVRSERELQDYIEKYRHLGVKGNLSVPPTARSVLISDAPEDPTVEVLIHYTQVGGDKDGKPQTRPKDATKQRNDGRKWVRINQFTSEAPAMLDPHLTKKAVENDDEMAVIAFMRRTGARVGSDPNNPKRGALDLQRQDIVIRGKVMSINYEGKKWKTQEYEIDDPVLLHAIKTRLAKIGKAPTAKLFNSSSKRTIARLNTFFPEGRKYQNHDLRRAFATEEAINMVKAMRAPKSKADMLAKIKSIGAAIDVMLNDDKQALESYVNPAVFDTWRKMFP